MKQVISALCEEHEHICRQLVSLEEKRVELGKQIQPLNEQLENLNGAIQALSKLATLDMCWSARERY